MKKTKKRKWYSLIDKVMRLENLKQAFDKVKRNHGAPGVDKITIETYEKNLEDNLRMLQVKVKTKSYKSRPVRRVYIDKANGDKRPLGIPTVEDRILQQAVRQIVEPIYDEKFLASSYGFRPGLDAHMAVDSIRHHLKSKRYVIDADLKSYFDTLDHEILIKAVREEIIDGSLLELMSQFLKAGVMEDGIVREVTKGAPQGGVISPLFGNIYLHPLDVLMAERGHPIVRYADDFVIFHESRKGAERVLKSITKFLEGELKLKIHPEKTRIVDSYRESFIFLGFEFKPGDILSVPDKKKQEFKDKVKKITRRNQTVNLEILIRTKLNPYIRGWVNYFGIASIKVFLERMMEWIRRRLRSVQMRSWKKFKNLAKAMRKNGWKGEIETFSMFRWRNSKTKQASFAMPNKWFAKIGLCNLVSIYDDYHPQRG